MCYRETWESSALMVSGIMRRANSQNKLRVGSALLKWVLQTSNYERSTLMFCETGLDIMAFLFFSTIPSPLLIILQFHAILCIFWHLLEVSCRVKIKEKRAWLLACLLTSHNVSAGCFVLKMEQLSPDNWTYNSCTIGLFLTLYFCGVCMTHDSCEVQENTV